MITLCLMLVAVGLLVSLPMTGVMRSLGHRLGTLDGAGVAGQVKAAPRRVPNTGGVGVFLGIALPMAAGLALVWGWMDPKTMPDAPEWVRPALEHAEGIRARTPDALVLLGALLGLHVLGVIDDRRPLGATPKLLIMLAAAAGAVWFTDTRLLTMLDPYAGGAWLSILLTVLWIGVITNAFNFLDNMDGLSGGVALIAAGFFLSGTLASEQPQWFIAACLALLIGSLLGFLFYNFPWRGPATIFMGDGGSLVIGFLLAFLTVRTTYVPEGAGTGGTAVGGGGAVVFMPVVVMAIPLYDFVSVTIIRLRQGKSPFVGDLQHFSHRLVRRGLSKRRAVLVICGCTAVTAIGGVSLPRLETWQAALVGVQTLLVLGVLGMYEWSASAGAGAGASEGSGEPRAAIVREPRSAGHETEGGR